MIGAASGKRGWSIGIAAASAVLLLVLFGLSSSVSWLEWTEDVNPISWYLGAQPLTDGFAVEFLWLVLTVGVFTAISVWGFERRDVSV